MIIRLLMSALEQLKCFRVQIGESEKKKHGMKKFGNTRRIKYFVRHEAEEKERRRKQAGTNRIRRWRQSIGCLFAHDALFQGIATLEILLSILYTFAPVGSEVSRTRFTNHSQCFEIRFSNGFNVVRCETHTKKFFYSKHSRFLSFRER